MSAKLSVIVPNPIATNNLASSTAPENDYAVWSSATTYALGALVISTVTHRIYESMQASNLNKDPTDIKNQSGATVYWLDVGPTNRWAMFDGEVSTQTVIASPLTVVMKPGVFNSIYMAGLDADDVTITVKDAPGGNVIFSYTAALEGSAPGDYDEYFWDPFKPLSDLVVEGIEQYGSAELTLTLSKGSGTVKCGVMSTGDLRVLGKTLYGAKVKPKSYSYIKTDDFGVTKIVRRKATTDMSLTAHMDMTEAQASLGIIQSLLDVPAIWIGSNLPIYGGLRTFGLGSGEITYAGPDRAELSLSVMGVISTAST